MSVLHIKDFPDDLHKDLKRFALDDTATLKDIVVAACAEYRERRKSEAQGSS